ncbi:MAG TPA: DUF2332 domain-containing protein [Rhizomicrobium sp.]
MSERSFDYWAFFVEETKRMHAPLYTRIIEGVSEDENLKAFAGTVRKGQPPANILLAAVHYLLLRGAQHPLRRFYPNLNGGVGRGGPDPFPDFRDFVNEHRAALALLIASKVTNTNEVGRSAFLHAAFRVIAQEAGEPLHLVEIGPSAGLNQRWDEYGVRYHRGTETFAVGPQEPALVLDVELRGNALPPLGATPKVATRVGLEVNRVDLSDPDQRDWLRALVWPDQLARFGQLERALEIALQARPNILTGDALELLPDVLCEVPANEAVCVYHTFVTYQFPEEKRQALDDLLVAVSLRRAVWRLSIEGTLTGEAPMLLYAYREGSRDKRILANCSGHGTWLEWRAG